MKRQKKRLAIVFYLTVLFVALVVMPACDGKEISSLPRWDTSPKTLNYRVVERFPGVDGEERLIERILTLEITGGRTVHYSTSGGLSGDYLIEQSGMLIPSTSGIVMPLEGLYGFACLPDEPQGLTIGDTWTRLDPTEEQIAEMGEIVVIQERVEYVCQSEEVYEGEQCLKITWESYVRIVENPAGKDYKQSFFDFIDDEDFFNWYANGTGEVLFNLNGGCTEKANYTYRIDILFGAAAEKGRLVQAELSRLR